MSAFENYLALRAVELERAIPKASRRHVHISTRPLILLGYHLAGDVGAPLALMWGTERIHPRLVVVPEPRNRELRFDALRIFGADFAAYLESFNEDSGGAPQIIVPNRATAEWLFGIVGRFTRNLRLDSNPAPHPIVPLAGKHLSFFHNQRPGSNLVLPATESLIIHWQTGQLPSENLNLSSLLAWIAPDANTTGANSAKRRERLPPAGPLSDPNWDADSLAKLNQDWHHATLGTARARVVARLEADIREQLDHTWMDCWHARELISSLPEANSVARRWDRDRNEWLNHYKRIETETAWFRNVPTPIHSARTLKKFEDATKELESDMALDDPLVLAKYVASGEAFPAKVLCLDVTRIRQPHLILEPLVHVVRPPGAKLFLTTNREVEIEILSCDANRITANVVSGACTKKTHSRLPLPGDEIILGPFGKPGFFPHLEFEEVPWTHQISDHTIEAEDE
ncbi:hypothetical protein [Tardiphaga sp.]|uniref:hypothetical protein n=1 Tax=Tardiphaga sp. TaxID=1926292 RepID=UPI0026026D4E|nr:hypothetical protein [Tardiphaga sp.]MDB5621344.1 hypothetical protein [Tardiphaga sp.]